MCGGGGGGGGGGVSRSTPVSIPRPTPVVEQHLPKMPVLTSLFFTDGIDKPKDKVKPLVVEQKEPDDLKK